jgi:hypothetical protein
MAVWRSQDLVDTLAPWIVGHSELLEAQASEMAVTARRLGRTR